MNISKSMRIGIIMAAIAVIYALSVFSMSKNDIEVEIGAVEARLVRTTILASGEIAFVNSVDLRPEITGVVSKVNVEPGQFVRRGDILLEFDQSAFNAELRQQRANIAMQAAAVMRSKEAMSRAQRQAVRSKEIHERQLISRDSYDEIITTAELAGYDHRIAAQNLEMATALRERIEDNLRKTVIRAPFDGQIIDIAIKQGETAVAGITNIAGSQLLTLADTREVVANLFIDEIDIGRVSIGQKVEVDIVAFSDIRLMGEISELSLAAEPKQSSESLKYEAQVSFAKGTELPVRKRMTVRAEVVVSSQNADLAVPLRAVLSEPGGGQEPHYFVFVMVDGRARKKSIELGRSDDEYQVVNNGVKRGDRLVIGPYQTLKGLKDGDTIAARSELTVK